MTFFVQCTRSIPGLFFITVVAIFTCITSSWAQVENRQNKPVRTVMVIHCDYPPVSFWKKNADRPAGFVVDIMDRVAERAGLQVTYICKNGWSEMLDTIESGEADVGALMKSEERQKRMMFSTPIEVSYLSYFARSQSNLSAGSAPEGHAVGVVKGSMSYEQLKNRYKEGLLTYGSYQDGLFGLLSGEIGLFAGEESMIQKRARETHLEDRIKKTGRPFAEHERGLVVKKGNVQLLELLNKALHGFKEGPEYQRIYLKWYGAPTPYWTNARILTTSGVFLFVAICSMALWRYVSVSEINKDLIRSISDLRHAEEQIMASLREKEILLKEIHHRVKNNLQVVASMLSLQSGYIKDKEARKLFEESQKRVESMSLIHEKLYRAKDLAKIDFKEYTGDLVSNLSALNAGKSGRVEIRLDIEGVILDINNAIPCGLIINELVSNALRHAFPDGRNGDISIRMRSSAEGGTTLDISDNGTGFSESIDFRNTKSLGMQLVISLVSQLDGAIELDRSEGTSYRIAFGHNRWRGQV